MSGWRETIRRYKLLLKKKKRFVIGTESGVYVAWTPLGAPPKFTDDKDFAASFDTMLEAGQYAMDHALDENLFIWRVA